MTFYEVKKKYDKFNFEQYISAVSDKMIKSSICKSVLNDMDFLNIISPKATKYIEEIAQKAHNISVNHFGKNILLYAPLYVSNFCTNNCVYCGFSTANKIKREVLTFEKIEENCKILSSYGIRHVLLVTGESNTRTPLSYLKKCISMLRNYFDGIDIEIYPLDECGYKELLEAGADGLTIYQETYNEKLYRLLHTKGAKANYYYRLEACERAGKVNYRSLNVGVLMGLNDFISEVFFVGLHAAYLQNNFPSAEISISFPRLRPTVKYYKPKITVSDQNLIQAICAVRIFINRVNITISTRENQCLRSNLIPLGITKMSAGSSTEVGGYINNNKKQEFEGQFKINDTSTVNDVKKMIYKMGYQPVMKNWLVL
ncbi:MAG: 2-iminoacetate synthase ThiH [Endomicrobium sp.]|nr:2-iminoacetate synthase ThiH [Endomicrobium sp.]